MSTDEAELVEFFSASACERATARVCYRCPRRRARGREALHQFAVADTATSSVNLGPVPDDLDESVR